LERKLSLIRLSTKTFSTPDFFLSLFYAVTPAHQGNPETVLMLKKPRGIRDSEERVWITKKLMTQVMTNDPHVQGPLVQFLCPVSAVRRGSSLPRLSHALRLAIYCYRFLWWMDGPLLRFKASPTTPRFFHTQQICHTKGESWKVIFLATVRSTVIAKSEMYLGYGSSPDMFFLLSSSTQRAEGAAATKLHIQ